MNTFVLKTRHGEVINKTTAIDIDDAREIFAKIKKLSVESLMTMFIVERLKK